MNIGECMITNARWIVFKLHMSVWLYDKWFAFRGIHRCLEHGYYSQRLIDGYCKECGKVPDYPPMTEMCTFCQLEEPVVQRMDPNGSGEVWSVCWECDKFIDWTYHYSFNVQWLPEKDTLDFDQWLFKYHGVYPKHEWKTLTLTKK